MLVLTRKLQQQIKIGDNIVLTILKVKGQTVRVGIEAPRDVHVVRSELPPTAAASQSEADAEPTSSQPSTQQPMEFTLVLDDEATSDDDRVAPKSPATPRLPQRRAFNRYACPPIKVSQASAALAIAK